MGLALPQGTSSECQRYWRCVCTWLCVAHTHSQADHTRCGSQGRHLKYESICPLWEETSLDQLSYNCPSPEPAPERPQERGREPLSGGKDCVSLLLLSSPFPLRGSLVQPLCPDGGIFRHTYIPLNAEQHRIVLSSLGCPKCQAWNVDLALI